MGSEVVGVKKYVPTYLDKSEKIYVTIIDLDSNYAYVNRAFTKRFKSIMPQFIGFPFQTGIHPDDIPKCYEASEKCFKNPNKSVNLSIRKSISVGGNYVETAWEFSALFDDINQPVGIICIGFDKTMEANLSKKIKTQENHFQLIIDKMKTGIIVQNPVGKILYFNKKADQLFSLSNDKYTADYIFPDYVHLYGFDEKPSKQLKKSFELAKRNKKPVLNLVFGIKKHLDEEVQWLQINIKPELDEKGELIQMVSTFADINRLVKYEQEVQKTRTQLQTMMDFAPMVIFMKNLDGKYLFFNKMYKEFIGKDLKPGITDFDIFDKNFAKECVKKDSTVFTGETLSFEHEVGTEQFFETKFPIRDKEGKIFALGGISQNVTNTKKQENLVKEALKEKTILLAEIHHRVKNNLAIISGLLELQKMETEDENILLQLNRSVSRIQSIAMVHELIYQNESLSAVDVSEYLNKLVQADKKTMLGENHKIDIKVDVPSLYLNINQLVPVGLLFNELLTNTFKYAFIERKEGKVDISMRVVDEKIHFEYKDNGSGFIEGEDFMAPHSLGLTLIHTQLQQLKAVFEVNTNDKFHLKFNFGLTERGPHSNIL